LFSLDIDIVIDIDIFIGIEIDIDIGMAEPSFPAKGAASNLYAGNDLCVIRRKSYLPRMALLTGQEPTPLHSFAMTENVNIAGSAK